ncbi:hypothetical protein AGDE_13024 [Angomonas deanei]|uniref:Uncharacterized protein n=1 Tax=Angomonas deanei TaxID=59799 RepID=A0A7G2CA02_9TRYP|nr:hypothetical protein AGDE_13024 [Angomonas deanei]CAD2215697.1 hypothetical protein, conserved [Angomonas deanei]|eukprot:EPY22859.1 hypothetical protein AGDE_13024 [Angomonas deanei]
MRDPVENRKTGVPPREPTVMDSRLHFVLRRPELCRRGLSCPSEDGVEENRAGAVSLVPFLHIDRYIDSVFDANDGGAHHVNGRYYLIGDPSRKKSISTMVDMSGSAIPVEELPNHNNNNHPPPTSNEEDALRLYLGDLLEGLQRSQNYAK